MNEKAPSPRMIFVEECGPDTLTVWLKGEITGDVLDALDGFIARHRKRIAARLVSAVEIDGGRAAGEDGEAGR